ncbi:WD repeat-containing protein 18 [Merluccius polli]|uniref:WD repeat-containing protein 18 n=1 Tax=Merluccius polli TaxID=89951 RepID=A0AA47MIK9_MERPO|nr:WD repeat-containing protein 18 [Merluccius polli]
MQQKIVCPGVVTCLTASPNGLYLVAGIAEALYLWEVSTGSLLAVLSRHYQDISCVKFTDDSSHFITGGKDNLALVWRLARFVVQLDQGCRAEPLHVLSRHSLPVTDLYCGLMGPQARVATASLDQTVKLWELCSGELLLSILFDVGIMSVTLDPCEYFLFCGGSDGNIFQVSLCSQSLSRDKTFQSESDGNQVFKGHRNLVSCLSVSMDGTLLLSGSHDETLRLWDVQSKQSIRCFTQKGQVTNCAIMVAPANMLVPGGSPAAPLPRFHRQLVSSQQAEGQDSGDVCLRLGLNTQEKEETYLQNAEKLFSIMTAVTDKTVCVGGEESSKVRVVELEEEVRTLKKVNKDLYQFSSQLLTKP